MTGCSGARDQVGQEKRGACVYSCGRHPDWEGQGNTRNLRREPPARRTQNDKREQAAIDLAAAHFEDLGYVPLDSKGRL